MIENKKGKYSKREKRGGNREKIEKKKTANSSINL